MCVCVRQRDVVFGMMMCVFMKRSGGPLNRAVPWILFVFGGAWRTPRPPPSLCARRKDPGRHRRTNRNSEAQATSAGKSLSDWTSLSMPMVLLSWAGPWHRRDLQRVGKKYVPVNSKQTWPSWGEKGLFFRKEKHAYMVWCETIKRKGKRRAYLFKNFRMFKTMRFFAIFIENVGVKSSQA